MLEQLQANLGKHLVLELANGKKISGQVISVNEQSVRMETEEGTGIIPVGAIMVAWENPARSLTEDSMEYLANKLSNSENTRITCNGVPAYNCVNQYYCVPPDNCVRVFSCPGQYVPASPQGGCVQFHYKWPFHYPWTPFAAPYCSPFQYQFCGPGSFLHHCRQRFQCISFQFYHPCGPYHFNQPCNRFHFHQPCVGAYMCGTTRFQCGPHPFSAPCNAPGGFTCAGTAFIGAPAPRKTIG